MLNKDNQRELCYVVTIDEIKPIEGKDRVECAVVGGWTIMVKKDQFHPGDAGIYFEIDSKVPAVAPFEFLEPKHYKIKTQKYGKFYSQGLLMHPSDFGWSTAIEPVNGMRTEVIIDDEGKAHYPDDESRFLTKKLGVVYSVKEDNKRKGKGPDKYAKMAQRHSKLFAKAPFNWLMKRTWGKKFLFIFFGKARDKKNWPAWVTKTDEERVENMTWVLADKGPWIATEKIDGTSTTFTMKRAHLPYKNHEFYVCSRNVMFDEPGKQCFYDSNVYLEMAEKYNIKQHLDDMLGNNPEWDWVTIQGETYGAGIQKNNYDLNDHRFMAFNFITSADGRWSTPTMKVYLESGYNIPCVPVLSIGYQLPDTVEELREYVHSEPSTVNGKIKEGIVFRNPEGTVSFKCVDPAYLIKYHS